MATKALTVERTDSTRLATGAWRLLSFLLPPLSLLGATLLVVSMFGAGRIIHSVQEADLSLILVAVVVGTVIEAVKAQRSAIMLRRECPITWRQSFGTTVLSKAAGHVLPFGATTLALRCLLTRRVAGAPIAFSTGVFLAGDLLDRLALLPLLGIVLLSRGALLLILLLTLLAVLGAASSSLIPRAALHPVLTHRGAALRRTGKPVSSLGAELLRGATTVTAAGWRSALPILGLSLLATALAILRLWILLRAFSLHATSDHIFLLILLSGLLGCLPVSIPGTGVWTSAQLLRLVGVMGPGAGGYVLVSSGIAAGETPLLALAVLAWWCCFHSAPIHARPEWARIYRDRSLTRILETLG